MTSEPCAICLDPLEEFITLSCSHRFHKKCINQVIYKFEDDNHIDFTLNPCPMCRSHLSCQDKRLCITGKQFTRVMHNILISDIENKPECVGSIYDAYQQVEEEHETVTAEHVYEEIFAWRETKLSSVEDGYFDSDDQKIIREYTEILDVCKRYFGF